MQGILIVTKSINNLIIIVIKVFKFSRQGLLLFFLLFGLTISVTSQNKNIQFESIQEGLSQSNVTCILQDKYGFMWFGTRNGLNQYDGYNFKIYERDQNDKYSISDNWIGALLEDSKGNIWIGTYGGGVNVFNHATQRFKRYQLDENNPNSLSNDNVASIYEDSKGNVWIATAKGLNRYVDENDHFIRYTKESSALEIDDFSIVIGDKRKNLWLGTQNNGLVLFDPVKGEPIKVFKANQSGSNSISGNKIKAAIIDHFGSIWIGTAENGLNKISISDEGKFSFKQFMHNANDSKSLSHNSVISLCEDKEGFVWAGTENGGLNKLDIKTEKFLHFKNEASDLNSISSNSLWSIYEDNTGILWIGTFNKGISKLDKKRFKFRHFKHSNVNENSLNQNAVNAFIEDKKGNIWIGTDGGGLNYFNPKTEKFLHLKNTPENKSSLGSNAVLDLFHDSKDRLWVATWGGGINVLEDINKPINKFKHFRQEEHFFNIVEDADHTFWLASWEGGVIHIDEKFNVIDVFSPLEQNPQNQISSINIFGLLLDRKNRIWVATLNGVNLGTKQANGKYKFESFLHHENDSNSISSNISYFIFQDSKEQIWIGTNSGLSLYQESSQSFKNYNKSDGLPDVDIKSMIEDDEGNFWLGTTRGLSKVVDIDKKDISNYMPGDGLQGTEFNRNAIYKTSDGKILAGGNNGYNYFSLKEIKNNTILPRIYLTSFKIFNEEVLIDIPESPLKKNILITNEITLSYEETVFAFEYVGLNYTHPDRNQYAFRLDGLEKNWNYVNDLRTASYSNLDAGKYTFLVKATNNDGIWNETPVRLVINVTPPWWELWWVKALLALLIVGIGYTFYKTRTNILKAQKRRLEYKVEERTAEIRSANRELQEQKEEITIQNEELSQQSEEIVAQRDKIEENHRKLASSYKDIQIVSKIGKDITSTFSVDNIVKAVFQSVKELMPADNFSIALHNPMHKTLDFYGIESNDETKVLYDYDNLTSKGNLSVLCFNTQENIFINDVDLEIRNYLQESSAFKIDRKAFIYLPLVAEQKKLGIITVQSLQANNYEERHLTLLETLASYIAIALDNANAYKVINDKNEQITDSIRYALTIQQAILPNESKLKYLFKDHFTLYKPKDIVSGDFYYLAEITDHKFYFAVADCTGHGVPGAFMSMIGSRILDEIIYDKRIYAPSEILENLNNGIRKALNQDAKSANSNTDGMDISLCLFDKKDNEQLELTFSGAKSTMYVIQDEEFKVFKGDRKSIGGRLRKQSGNGKSFTDTIINLKNKDKIYFTTDGIIDQCSPERKRFGSTRLKKMILDNHKHSFQKQNEILSNELGAFQNQAKQRDDITLVGILV